MALQALKMKDNLKRLLQSFAALDEWFLTPQGQDLAGAFAAELRSAQMKRRGNYLLQLGNCGSNIWLDEMAYPYYVHTGCIRTFYVDNKGYEKTRYVMIEHQIGTTLSSFISQRPTIEIIQALDDTELLVISHKDFYHLTKEMDNWRNFYQKILEKAYLFQNRKIEALVTLTAKQRYEQLLTENPVLIQRLSNKVLASYLDMREETLSRLKSQ